MPNQAPASDPPFYGFCPVKSLSFQKILVTPLRVICGLAFLLQSKILDTPMYLVNIFFVNFILT